MNCVWHNKEILSIYFYKSIKNVFLFKNQNKLSNKYCEKCQFLLFTFSTYIHVHTTQDEQAKI